MRHAVGLKVALEAGKHERVALIGLPRLPGDMQPAVDVADFEHLIAQDDLLAVPRA